MTQTVRETQTTQGRVRRSIRYAQLEARSEAGVRTSSQRRERITGAERLEQLSFRNAQDWVNGASMSPSGRFQIPESPRKKQGVFGKTGLREDWAKAILWVLAAALALLLVVQFASVGASSIQIRKLEARIEAAENKSRELSQELAIIGGDVSVCTRAVELNLISSNGAKAIRLTAPVGATMNLTESGSARATQEPEMRATMNTGYSLQGD